MNIKITSKSSFPEHAEIAERKGIGHPDSICDEIAEEISKNLCRYYMKEFGTVLHHNVDKALLVGGESLPKYGGGKVIKPITFIIAGRATVTHRDKIIPVSEIAESTARNWFANRLKHLDAEKHVEISVKIRHGSSDLTELFGRTENISVPLANDTSFGAGYYPNTALQENILGIENLLNHADTKKQFPFTGEDIKVMGVRDSDSFQYTVAAAMIDKYIKNIDDYAAKIKSLKHHIRSELNLSNSEIEINTADNYEKESIYLTVTGTSSESGDDGQVGRGNRVNGLITPYFPMSLEASAGKNPVSHIGKIYNHFAFYLSRSIVENKYAGTAKVFIVSRIGQPINNPRLLHIILEDRQADEKKIEELVQDEVENIAVFARSYFSGLQI